MNSPENPSLLRILGDNKASENLKKLTDSIEELTSRYYQALFLKAQSFDEISVRRSRIPLDKQLTARWELTLEQPKNPPITYHSTLKYQFHNGLTLKDYQLIFQEKDSPKSKAPRLNLKIASRTISSAALAWKGSDTPLIGNLIGDNPLHDFIENQTVAGYLMKPARSSILDQQELASSDNELIINFRNDPPFTYNNKWYFMLGRFCISDVYYLYYPDRFISEDITRVYGILPFPSIPRTIPKAFPSPQFINIAESLLKLIPTEELKLGNQ